ncbi:beta-1,3-galactosyltransferase 5-like [Melitaea cinxia]|uniref:beta-1,3-galactosyltransferase 5-like n=1 Tax=Melitaea cinxia TaxID=113334 RepID=UPI001E2737D1|nr:beta-1,3-galactosyltransferase 5-like [Melitaea cinxia]
MGYVILTLLSLVLACWLAKFISRAMLPPLPVLEHYKLNRNLKSYLENIEVVIEPSSTVCLDDKDIPLLVLVTSSPTRFEQREAIRSTWGKYVPTYFILGLTGPIEDLMKNNYVEAKKYSDIIIYNFQDHYQNLTLKTALMLKWTTENCSPNMMMLKTDDDVIVNPWMMKRVLQENSGKDLVGYRMINNYVHRYQYSKYYIPRWLLKEDVIPEYLSGTGYLINGRHIEKILKTAYKVPMINLEDVYFTYLVSRLKLGLTLTHDYRLSPYKPWIGKDCMYSGLALAHSLTPREILKAWSAVEAIADTKRCESFMNTFWSAKFLY